MHVRIVCQVSGVVVAQQFKNLQKQIYFLIKLSNLQQYKCILNRFSSLLKEKKVVLNASFDFTYRKLKKSSLPIISKNGFDEKKVLVK